MTHSFADDVEILPLLTGRSLAYLGSLGPAQRRLKLLEEVEQSVGLDKQIAERAAPVGLDLGRSQS